MEVRGSHVHPDRCAPSSECSASSGSHVRYAVAQLVHVISPHTPLQGFEMTSIACTRFGWLACGIALAVVACGGGAGETSQAEAPMTAAKPTPIPTETFECADRLSSANINVVTDPSGK